MQVKAPVPTDPDTEYFFVEVLLDDEAPLMLVSTRLCYIRLTNAIPRWAPQCGGTHVVISGLNLHAPNPVQFACSTFHP